MAAINDEGMFDFDEIETCALEFALCENPRAERMAMPRLPQAAHEFFAVYRRMMNDLYAQTPQGQHPVCGINIKHCSIEVVRSYMQYEWARLMGIAPVAKLSCGHSVGMHCVALKRILEVFPKEKVH